MKTIFRKAILIPMTGCCMAALLAGCAGVPISSTESAKGEPTAPEATVTMAPAEEAEAQGDEKIEGQRGKKKGEGAREKPAQGEKEADDSSKKTRGKQNSEGAKAGKKNGESTETGKKSGRQESGSKRSSGGKGGSKSSSAGAAAGVKDLADGETVTGGTFVATGADESALTASGTVTATVTGATIQKTSGEASSADGASFQGLNAGVRVYGSATVTLTDCVVEASAKNATGVFAYDQGTIYLDGCAVTVTGGGAGGVQVAGGGTLYGKNLTVTSASKAAIRSDRGGGTMVLEGGTYTSTGTDGCPAIYSTADITVKNAVCLSTGSRAVIIEGKNSVTLENCTLTGNDQSTKAGSVRANVLLYQSASGDAGVGTSVFTMTGGSMTAQSGAMFYCTNTSSRIELSEAELTLAPDGQLLIVSAGRWGKEGKNGGQCILNAKGQSLAGDIIVDSISSLELNLVDSAYTGAILGEGAVKVTLSEGSTWTLTGDSRVSSVEGDLSGLNLNGFTLYVNGVAYTKAA